MMWKRLGVWLVVWAVMVAVAGVMTGCRGVREVEVVRVRVDTVRDVRVVRDSTVVRDSMVVWVEGDTVVRERWVDRWRERVRVDTVVRVRTDTVVRVEEGHGAGDGGEEVGWWGRMKMELGGWAVGVIVAGGLVAVVWLARRRWI